MDEKTLDRAAAMSHRFRFEVLTVLFRGTASATEVAAAIGAPVDKVRFQLRRLREQGFVEEVESRRRRGTVERYYVTVDREVILLQADLEELPEELRKSLDAHLLKAIIQESLRALTGGTMAARDDGAIVRFPMSVDRRGWRELSELHLEMLERVQAVKDRAQVRLRAGREEPIRTSSVTMLFELPPSAESADDKHEL